MSRTAEQPSPLTSDHPLNSDQPIESKAEMFGALDALARHPAPAQMIHWLKRRLAISNPATWADADYRGPG